MTTNSVYEISKLSRKNVINAYGHDNWGALPNFVEGLINFGYWDMPCLDDNITLSQRKESSLRLYEVAAKYLELEAEDSLVEIGSGTGIGLEHIKKQYSVNKVVGIDLVREQVERAQRSTTDCTFILREADDTGLTSSSVDKILSVEVVQHMSSLQGFAEEMFRILKTNGIISITTYFSTHTNDCKRAVQALRLAEEGYEYPWSIQQLIDGMLNVGFSLDRLESIGDHVFWGYNRWITQQSVNTPCSYNYDAAYRKGLIDYYLVRFTKR